MPIDPDAVPLVVAFVALVVGLTGAGVSVAAILQKSRADRRDALWERSRLAIVMSQSGRSKEQLLGLAMIELLLDQDELTENDAALLVLAAQAAVAEGEPAGAGPDELLAIRAARVDRSLDTGPDAPDDGQARGGSDE